MSLEEVISQCTSLPEVEETTPFGPDVLVYKVAGKMFALTNPDDFPVRVNLKCEPEKAIDLRERFEAVVAGYHMNKRHWNTVMLDGSISSELLREWVEDSYRLVAMGLKKADRQRVLAQMDGKEG